jgi:hypothetical protein
MAYPLHIARRLRADLCFGLPALRDEPPSSSEADPSARPFWRDEILPRDACSSEKVQRLARYWESLREGSALPRRRDIDAAELGPLLAYMHLSEWHTDPDRVRYRLAGTELVAAIGREISGRWLSEFHTDPADMAETMNLYRRVIAARAPVFGRTSTNDMRRGVRTFYWVLCPLSETGAQVTHFVGLEDYVSPRRYLGGGV